MEDEPDIVARLRESDGGYFVRKMFTEAADEIERLRIWRDRAERRDAMRENTGGIDWKHRALCAEATLARYKRAYARSCCRDLYSSGARWKITKNPMRNDGVFIEEDCKHGDRRTYFPFPHQFDEDVADEIVMLLNRATEELEQQSNNTEPAALRGTAGDAVVEACVPAFQTRGENVQTEKAEG